MKDIIIALLKTILFISVIFGFTYLCIFKPEIMFIVCCVAVFGTVFFLFYNES